jgi:TRAP transporter TAXI family solute receptor
MAIRIGTSEHGGTFHSQGLALKAVLDRRPPLAPVEVLESDTASIQNANRLNAGEIELGFMASNWIGRARRGEPPFTGAIDIRMAAPMNAGPLFFITRAGSAVHSLADLRGRRIAVGPEKSGMVQHVHTIFGVLGVAFTEFTPVYLDFAAGAQALAAGEIDVQFQCPIPNKVMTELSERADVRVLPYPPGELEKVLGAVSFYRRTIMRKGAFRGIDSDVPQVAVVNILATHARVPESVVREAVATIVASTDELGRLNPLFAGLGELFAPLKREGTKALEFGSVALHPGAAAAYREAGLL